MDKPLGERFRHLVGNTFQSDFTFIIEEDNTLIPAHKLIVSTSSPFLQRIVYGNEGFPGNDIVLVSHISREAFMEILFYIYTDTINLNDDNVFEIIFKSNYLGLIGIVKRCIEYLEEILNASSFIWIYHQLFNGKGQTEDFLAVPLAKLLKKCQQYMRVLPMQFFAAEDFVKLSADEFRPVLEMDSINCTEMDLFGAVIRLSKAICTARGLELSGPNQRECLHGIDTLLRMDTMTEQEFEACLAMQEDFFSSEEIEKYRVKIRDPLDTPEREKRKWYTFKDGYWFDSLRPVISTTSAQNFLMTRVYRLYRKGDEPQFVWDSISRSTDGDKNINVQILAANGLIWCECVNGELPIGAVHISKNDSDPKFLARRSSVNGSGRHYGPASVDGRMLVFRPNLRAPLKEEQQQIESYAAYKEDPDRFIVEILTKPDVENPDGPQSYINGIPCDAIQIESDCYQLNRYLGRARYLNKWYPAVITEQFGATLLHIKEEINVSEYKFVRMVTGTYEWIIMYSRKVPKNAIVGGIDDRGYDIYFGRTLSGRQYRYGYIEPHHGCLYTKGITLGIRSHFIEILVEIKKKPSAAKLISK